MGEANASVADGDDLGVLGLVERTAPSASATVLTSATVGWAIAAAAASARSASGDSVSEPCAHQFVERDGQPLARLELDCARLYARPSSRAIERVAAGQLVEAPKRGPRWEDPEALLHEVLHGAQAQWREADALDALVRGGAVQREWNGRSPPSVRQAATSAIGPVDHAADGKAEHQRRGGIEPLHIVDGDHERTVGGKPTEDGEERRVRRSAGLAGPSPSSSSRRATSRARLLARRQCSGSAPRWSRSRSPRAA